MAILTRPEANTRIDTSGDRSWQNAMRDAVRDPAELCRLLRLPDVLATEANALEGPFPLFVPRGYVARMEPGNLDDPLLQQVLPRAQESVQVPGFGPDPVEEEEFTLQPGLLQKYQGRALLVTTGVCAIHCRYCFRRHYPYAESVASPSTWDAPLKHLAGDTSIREVILRLGRTTRSDSPSPTATDSHAIADYDPRADDRRIARMVY